MRTIKQGDQVCVHFVKRFQDGGVCSSRGRAPLEVTVGTEHARLRGLGSALVGLGEGDRVHVLVDAEHAYGLPRPERVRQLARGRFPQDEPLAAGKLVRVLGNSGRRRLVRVVEVHEDRVVVDTNHPRAGQAVALEVEIVSIRAPEDPTSTSGKSGDG